MKLLQLKFRVIAIIKRRHQENSMRCNSKKSQQRFLEITFNEACVRESFPFSSIPALWFIMQSSHATRIKELQG